MNRVPLPPIAILGLAALTALDVALAAAAWSSLATPVGAALPAASEWQPPSLDGGAAPAPRPVVADPQTLARPVFFRTRRPALAAAPAPTAVAAPAAPPAAAPDPGFALTGIAIVGDRRQAYVASRSDPTGTWVAQDGEIEGWTVTAVDAQGAILRSGGRTIELKLYKRP